MLLIKIIIKIIITLPQVLRHKWKGIDEPYFQMVDFFRYFPLASINLDKSVNIKYNKTPLKFYYGPQGVITCVGEFFDFDYSQMDLDGKLLLTLALPLETHQ